MIVITPSTIGDVLPPREKVKSLFYPPAPPPVYQIPSQVIPIPQGYGYVYSGGQGNLNVI